MTAERGVLVVALEGASLHRRRDSLARLRRHPQVALLVLAEGNVAFTARGSARIAAEPMADAPDHAAVAIDVTELDDHRQPAFTGEAGVDRAWVAIVRGDDHESTLTEMLDELLA